MGWLEVLFKTKKIHNSEPYIPEWYDLWQLQPYFNTSAVGIREHGWVLTSVGKNYKCQL